ncbi:hypothetical protein LIER_40141 [Lithospermum erythrorhizon]|uniref:DUF4283 domain-containing protein n=1 Tax=Lithospermum erythrorhizon TaxID=34254 RepID=A0AAV3QQ92_LITER
MHDPYNVNGALLLLDRWIQNLFLQTFTVNFINIWVQIHGVPIEYFEYDNIYRIGGMAREVIAVEWTSMSSIYSQAVCTCQSKLYHSSDSNEDNNQPHDFGNDGNNGNNGNAGNKYNNGNNDSDDSDDGGEGEDPHIEGGPHIGNGVNRNPGADANQGARLEDYQSVEKGHLGHNVRNIRGRSTFVFEVGHDTLWFS